MLGGYHACFGEIPHVASACFLAVPSQLLITMCTCRSLVAGRSPQVTYLMLNDLKWMFDPSSDTASESFRSSAGRNLTDMTAAAPESSISRPATSANSTATAIESVPVPGSTVQPLCNYGCDVYSRSSLGAAAVGSNWYFAACSASDCPNNKGIQYYCCAQTCKVDSDCPLFYFCPDGMSDDSYCTKCSSCSQTENAKCQTDQSCPSLPPPSPPQPVVSCRHHRKHLLLSVHLPSFALSFALSRHWPEDMCVMLLILLTAVGPLPPAAQSCLIAEACF